MASTSGLKNTTANVEDIFAIQDEISLTIVEKLKVKLLGEDKERLAKHYTDSFEVYDLYLKGTARPQHPDG